MAAGRLGVHGVRDFVRAADRAGKESKRAVRLALRTVGEPIRAAAASLFFPVDARTAAGYRVVVRQRGIAVEQRLRKTTGLHSSYGSLQMRRALLPALDENTERTQREMERALDKVADHFERNP